MRIAVPLAATEGSAFRTSVEQLFRYLDLGTPRFDATNIVRLRIEDLAVSLTDDGGGLMRLEGDVGLLPEEPMARADAVRSILRGNASFLLTNEAGVRLKFRPDGREAVAAELRFSYRKGTVEELVKKIEDVVQLLEYHRAGLTGTRSGRTMQQARSISEDFVILQP